MREPDRCVCCGKTILPGNVKLYCRRCSRHRCPACRDLLARREPHASEERIEELKARAEARLPLFPRRNGR